jgi:hypothetical protein
MGNGPDEKPTEKGEKNPSKGVGGFFSRLFGRGSDKDSSGWPSWLTVSVFASIAFVIVHALSAGDFSSVLRNIAAGLLLASAAGAVGVVIGFLFGIPRSLQRDDAAQNADDPFQSVKANTNLEQISDWLTKIIVGVGLTQAGKIVLMVENLATRIGPLFAGQTAATNATGSALVTNTAGSAFVLVVMVLFSIQGFLWGYLWARISLQETFNDMAQKGRRRPEYFEGLMNSYLYMPAPSGFRAALKLREDYEKIFGEALTDRMWTYSVNALGQKYAYSIEHEKKKKEDLLEDRAKLLITLKNALRKDEEAASLLRLELYPGKGRGPVELFEGDLRSFTEDPDFTKLLPKEPS